MTRTLLPLVIGLALVALAPSRAFATPPLDPTAVTIELGNPTADGKDVTIVSTSDKPKMFNAASCACGVERAVKVTIAGSSSQNGQTTVYTYIGSNCTDLTSRTSSCHQVSAQSLSDFNSSSQVIKFTTAEIVNPGPNAASCTPTGSGNGSSTFFVMIDFAGDKSFSTDTDTIQSVALDYDVQGPGLVTNLKASAGESAVNLSWTVPSDTDLAYIQVLCGRGELPVFKAGTYDPSFDSAESVCPANTDGGVGDGGTQDDGGQQDAGQQDAGVVIQQDAGSGDGGVVTGVPAYPEFVNLDPAFLCSGGLGSTASSLRVGGLQNGIPYYFAVVAVNKAGNASAVETMVVGTPQEMLDFWEGYKQDLGQATGCSVERPFGAGWAGLGAALLGLGLAFLAARRRPGGRP